LGGCTDGLDEDSSGSIIEGLLFLAGGTDSGTDGLDEDSSGSIIEGLLFLAGGGMIARSDF
jgi:hypothetical protein